MFYSFLNINYLLFDRIDFAVETRNSITEKGGQENEVKMTWLYSTHTHTQNKNK